MLDHDNASVHTAAQTLDFLTEFDVQLVTHLPYSSNLAQYNFYLFPYKYLKNFSYVVTKNIDKSHHYIQKDIENFLGGPNINFILNEHCYIAKLTFYEIVRNYSLITN